MKMLLPFAVLFLSTNSFAATFFGDVDGDGAIKVDDIFLVQKTLLTLSTLDSGQFLRADIYPSHPNRGDGLITLSDLLLLEKLLLNQSNTPKFSPVDKSLHLATDTAIEIQWFTTGLSGEGQLQLSMDTDFNTVNYSRSVQLLSGQQSSIIPANTLEENTSYYWRVIDNTGNSVLNTPLPPSFTTAAFNQGIHFQEVSDIAGINHISPSFGTAWGDFNGDGWLDIWSGNHYSSPSLYINQGDGTFIDIATSWTPPIADAHGAAWIDLDGDGNEEILQLSGGNIANRLIANENGVPIDNAIAAGLDTPGPRGRTPLWMDWNHDGNIDVILTRIRNSQKQPLALQNNDSIFSDYTDTLNITMADSNFAQIADINGDRKADLIFHNRINFLSSVYDTSTIPFQDISSQANITINTAAASYDTVIADFDNNLRNDFFVVKRRFDIELYQRSPRQLDAKVIQTVNYPVKKYTFITSGKLKISAYPYNSSFTPIDQVFIGSDRVAADQFPNTSNVNAIFRQVVIDLDPSDVRTAGQLDSEALLQDIRNQTAGAEGLFIGFNPASNEWQIISSLPNQIVNIVVESTADITSTDTGPYWTGIPSVAPLNLYMHLNDNDFSELSSTRGLSEEVSCGATVGADFDNDMDIDLYLVCTNGVSNVANKLFENDGTGHFTEVANAAGAGGSNIGLGENVAYADYDKDGFIDLFVVNGESLAPFHNGPHQLFRNIPNSNHWLQINLQSRSNTDKGLGATVIIETAGISQMREQNGGYHRYSQNSQVIHFGLADNNVVDSVTIYWPSGIIQSLSNVPANEILTITEPL